MLKSYCFLFNKTEQEIISHQDHDGICENKTVIYKEIWEYFFSYKGESFN